MARIVKMLGTGGAQQAEKGLGWNRGTIRKGLHELESGFIKRFLMDGRLTPTR